MARFDDFVRAAQARAAELRVDPTALGGCGEALAAAFPENWLRSQGLPRDDGVHGVVHPLNHLLVPADGHQQLVGLIELGSYLSLFSETPSLPDIHDGLHGDDALFEHTRLQLAFAYRFFLGGATDLRFEPPTDGGRRGDIAFEWEGHKYTVECYRPALADEHAAEVDLLLKQCRDELVEIAVPLVAEVRLAVLPDPPSRKEAVKHVRRAAEEMARALSNGLKPTGRLGNRFPAGWVGVRVGEGAKVVGPGEAIMSVSSRRGETPPRYVLGARAVEGKSGSDGTVTYYLHAEHSVHLWIPTEESPTAASDLTEPMVKLASRIEKKVKQARVGDARRVLIVDTALTAALSGPSDRRLNRFRKKLVKHHNNVAGILLVRRLWEEQAKSWRYQGIVVSEHGPLALPEPMVRALHTVETTGVWENPTPDCAA